MILEDNIMKKYFFSSLFFLIIFLIGVNLIIAKGIFDFTSKTGTILIIDSDGNVFKYVDGNLVDETFKAKKHGSFFLIYSGFEYNATNDKIPLKIQLPPHETLIYVNPQADRYTTDVESGEKKLSVTWDNTNPGIVYLEYGNVVSNFFRNLGYALRLR